MPVPRWLDRIWLTLIAISFCIAVPIWLILWSERLGFWTLAAILALTIATALRQRKSAASDPTADRAAP